jgi:ribosomal protein L7/L12
VNELKRQHARELRAANKANKRRKTSANRAPSGFVKPTLISNELAAFLGKPEGSVLARTEVTREVNAYIRAQKLQDKDNGRKINPDAKLLKLLKLKKGDELTYFNLQKYMAGHFAKSTPAVAVAAPAGGAVMMAAMPGAAGGEAAKEEEKTTFDVVLESFPADKKVAMLKVVRELTGIGLKEVKELVPEKSSLY